MKINLLYVALLCYSLNMLGQQDAWVYLTDKKDVQTALNNPVSILTQKAIDRKAKYGVAIDDRDVPVNESYISILKNVDGITVLAKSKWFNAIHVRGSQETILTLKDNFTFVQDIVFADPELNSSRPFSKQSKSKLEEASGSFNYGNTANQVTMITANRLHEKDYTGSGMTIAVMDTGFPGVNTIDGFDRLRAAGNIKGTYDFVNRETDVYNESFSHGTLVLSTMAGYVEDQFVGTAPDAAYYLFITEDGPNENPVEESYWVEAAERADSLGVDIINTSLGYGAFYENANYNYKASQFDGKTTYITRAANLAFEKGMLVVTSAGNEGKAGLNAPADATGVLSIGAVNASGKYVDFSSVGSDVQPTQKPDLVAQGQGCAVITSDNTVSVSSGTSFSAPILTGGIACLWQALPDKTNAEIMALVRETASQYSQPDYQVGYGIPNLFSALNNVLSVATLNENQVKIFPNPVKDELYIKRSDNYSDLEVVVYNLLGKEVLNKKIASDINKINIASLAKGVYLVRLKSSNTMQTIKLIKH